MNTPELTWFKSSYSSASGDDCVEVALTPTAIHVRDSKAPKECQLELSPENWRTFLSFMSTTHS
ncbi:DUF397 domain-containing protein [Streptomyces cyaneus]|uniref:DUF397 domain-containing protein n=1 Tax=Streptomyces cyaneus TaxID=1904 RepID=UPI000FF8B2AB|nr:DUF397 domain-containing protein [Streptomyces cyaneus]